MHIVINIPQKYYETIMAISPEKLTGDTVLIRYGTPLPKGHGRLIDADALMKLYRLEDATKYGNETAEQQTYSYGTMMMYEIRDMIDNAPTIIEAERDG